MSLISIVKAKGREATDIVESGSNVTLTPGDKVVIDAEHGALTTAVKEEASLLLGIRDKFTLTINNFFTTDDLSIEFNDAQLSSTELLDKLIVHVTVIHEDGIRRELLVAPFSTVPILLGDKFEFPNSEVKHNDVHREGDDLMVYFEPGSTAEGKFITLGRFFQRPENELKAPLLMLTDKEHQATDIIIHPEHHEQLQWHGVPITSATPGIPYGYYFYLTGEDLKNIEVELSALEGKLPDWLKLVKLGEGEFILSGTPPANYSAELNLEISAHEKLGNVNVHAQQQFQLKAMKAERRATERAMVTTVLAAELRGAPPAAHFAEGLVAGSEGALSSMLSAQLAVIAGVSSLSVANIAAARQMQVATFARFDVKALVGTEMEGEFEPIETEVGTLTTDTDSAGLHIGAGAQTIEQDVEIRTNTTDDEDTGSQIVGANIIPPPVIEPTGPSAEVLADLSNQRLSGEFRPLPDLFPAFESNDTLIPPEGVLANDIDTLLNKAFLEVLSVNGLPMSVGNPLNLASGAILTLNIDGSLTYNPNGQFEALPQGAIFSDFFFYTADNGLLTSSSSVTINVIGENDAPIIKPSQLFRTDEKSDNGVPFAPTEDIDIVEASDIDTGDVLTYAIPIFGAGTGQLIFSINPNTGLITEIDASALNFEQTPTLTLEVLVTDILGLTDTEIVTIRLIDVNEPPVIINPAPFEFNVNEDVSIGHLVGQVLVTDDDVDNGVRDSLTFKITDESVKGVFEIDDDGNITTSKTLDFEDIPVYTIEVTVNDNHTTDPVELSDVQVFTILVQDVNETPIITNSPLEFDVDENSEEGAAVGTVNVSDDDVDNGAPGVDSLTYMITGGTGAGLFDIDSNGDVTVAAGAVLDFETTPSYTLTVKVNDNHITDPTVLMDEETFTININDVNEPPMITNSPLEFTLAEGPTGGDLMGVVTATDDDVDNGAPGVDSLSFDIVGGADKNDFNIDDDGNITLKSGRELDFETQATYEIEVQVEDDHNLPGANLTDTKTFMINVTDVNEAPEITNNPLEFDVDENSGEGDAVGTVNVSDDDVDNGAPGVDSLTYMITGGTGENLFDIDSDGNVTVAAGVDLDFEDTASYTLTVKVNDNHTTDPTVLMDEETFTININDVNEEPAITNAQLEFDVDENSEEDDAVGTVTASDDDVDNGAPGVDSLTYMITGGTGENLFDIDSDGNVTVAAGADLDFEDTASYTLTVKVNDNHTTDMTELMDEETFTITINDVNEAPEITNSPLEFDLDENSGEGDAVGTVTVSDDDVDNGAPGVDSLTYMITGGTGENLFDIDGDGNVTVAAGADLDFEDTASYTLTVKVNDNHTTDMTELMDEETFTININDVNEAPEITNSPLEFNVNEGATGGDLMGIVTASDDDVDNGAPGVDSLSFDIVGGADKNDFKIDNDGNITLRGGREFDFETQSTYEIVVEVEDDHDLPGSDLSDTETFTINVVDVNEAPEITNSPLEFDVDENSGEGAAVGTVTVSDDDVDNGAMGVDSLTYMITGGTGENLFDIDSDGNVTVAAGADLDFEDTASYTLTVKVNDNHTTDMTELMDEETFTINIGDVNEAPEITNSPLEFNVNEGAIGGDLMGIVTASDDDVDNGAPGVDSLSFDIVGGADANDFTIDNDGNVTLKPGREFDFETQSSYEIQVQIEDNHTLGGPALSDTQTFMINVVDVNEAPEITNSPLEFDVDEDAGAGDPVGIVTVTDDDVDNGAMGVDSLTYMITGGTGDGLFDIDSDGNITVAADDQFDFETTTSYTLEITVNDNHTTDPTVLMDMETFTIEINDVAEPPALMALNGENNSSVNAAPLNSSALALMSAVAIQYWSLSGLAAEQIEILDDLSFSISDLQSGLLAEQDGNNIIVDIDAANYGWYVDGTPLDAKEFANQLSETAWQAAEGSEAVGQMDLYTVLMHEIGHAIGYDHVEYDANNPQLMADELAAGTRILPDDNLLDGNSENDIFQFENLTDPIDGGDGEDTLWFAEDNIIADLRGSEVFSDIEVIDLEAIESVFGNGISLDAESVHAINEDGLTINGGVNDHVQLAAADGWFISGVDHSHTQYSAASGSIVSIDNDVSVVVI